MKQPLHLLRPDEQAPQSWAHLDHRFAPHVSILVRLLVLVATTAVTIALAFNFFTPPSGGPPRCVECPYGFSSFIGGVGQSAVSR